MCTNFQYLGSVMDSGYFLYLFIILVGAVYGLYRFRILNAPFRLLALYLALVFVSELSTRFFAYYIGSSNPNYHVLIPLQIIFYILFFTQTLGFSKHKTHFLYAAGVIAILLSIANTLFIQPFFSMPSNSITLLALLVIALTLLQFKEMLTNVEQLTLGKNAIFWFCIGGLIFYSITFFLFSMFNPIGSVPTWGYEIIKVCNMVMYFCYGRSLYLYSKTASK